MRSVVRVHLSPPVNFCSHCSLKFEYFKQEIDDVYIYKSFDFVLGIYYNFLSKSMIIIKVKLLRAQGECLGTRSR